MRNETCVFVPKPQLVRTTNMKERTMDQASDAKLMGTLHWEFHKRSPRTPLALWMDALRDAMDHALYAPPVDTPPVAGNTGPPYYGETLEWWSKY